MQKVKLLLSGKPRIEYYIDAVEKCGAEAVAEYLPVIDTDYDGLILCGGSDIDPKYYNESIDGSVGIDEARDENEFALLEAYIKAEKPILGICRGHQLINTFFGGTLYQHIPEADLHTRKENADEAHEVKSVSGSILADLYGERFFVNSAHHQAIKKLGDGLSVSAIWDDKYIEAVEHETLPIIGVQWHPERMCFSQARTDTVSGSKIFEKFIEMCQENKNKKTYGI